MYRVMVVDDDPLMRKTLELMVSQSEGFVVAYSVANGQAAVGICQTDPVDIIFMDIMMPGISGLETAGRILARAPNISIFIISAYTSFKLAHQALRIKIKEYVSKPVSSAVIRNLLATHKTEHDLNVHKEVKKLLDILRSRDFNRVYYEMKPIATAIQVEASYDFVRMHDLLLHIGRILTNPLEETDNPDKKIEKLFPIDLALLSIVNVVELWLFVVMNHVFQQNSILRYPFLKTVFSFIDEHLKENIGLKDIVRNCYVSQGHLSRIFKKHFQISVMVYLHMRKLSLAKAYFIFTEHSLAEVAFRLGYNESGYFSKVFKKYEKLTVQNYRRICGRLDNQTALVTSPCQEQAMMVFGVKPDPES